MTSLKTKLAAAALAAAVFVPAFRAVAQDKPAAGAVAAAQPVNTLTEEEKKAGWVLLFDGKTTEGFRNFRKQTISPFWKVVDGTLCKTDSKAGDIITAGQYDSFELSLEYRIGKSGNSGIMFHVTEDGGAIWATGPEVQLQDNGAPHDPELSGWMYQLYKPAIDPATNKPIDATKPSGEWNQIRIIVTPKRGEVSMNGVKYYDFVKGSDEWNSRVAKSKFGGMKGFGKNTKGFIGFQGDHGGDLAFRNMKIRPLPAE